MRLCGIRYSRMILSGIQNLFGVLVIFICVGVVAPPVEGLIIESPKEGETIVVGEPIRWRVRLAPGEACKTVNLGYSPLNPSTGKYEWTQTITPESRILGKKTFFISGEYEFPSRCEDAEVTVNVVLPPTTVLKSINAEISNGREQGFMTLYKHENGTLVQASISFNKVTAGGKYSDGVLQEITEHPDTTYTSSDEKVLKVTPPGRWTLNDEFPQRPRRENKERHGTGALVTAVGPGRAEIIVRNGLFEDSVIGIVDVEPCSAWKKRAFKDDLPICD